jgi:hypothetical protein
MAPAARGALSTDPCPKRAKKFVRKGLDFFWEQSVTGPTSGNAKGSPGISPRRSLSPVRGFDGGGASRFNPARDPNHVSQETLIKQHPPDGITTDASFAMGR